ncbi:MAG: LytTR family DNA-binding domain-containing protein [Sediminibacterium sp.]|nr:LytTR family DNA-binding domain-containing protein [Sediminibacterium sp.]
MKLKAVAIDDEQSCSDLLQTLLKNYEGNIEIVGVANSVESGFNAIQTFHPDLIFLDVQMKDGTGFDLLMKLPNPSFRIIFITGFSDYAIEAFRWCAIDYLLKPLSPRSLYDALRKTEAEFYRKESEIQLHTLLSNLNQTNKNKRKIVLKTAERIYAVDPKDIIRLESDGNYTTFFLENGKNILVSRIIKEFDDLLTNAGFVRIHQSHLINISYLYCFEKTENQVIMQDNSIVPVSTRKKDQLMALISNL